MLLISSHSVRSTNRYQTMLAHSYVQIIACYLFYYMIVGAKSGQRVSDEIAECCAQKQERDNNVSSKDDAEWCGDLISAVQRARGLGLNAHGHAVRARDGAWLGALRLGVAGRAPVLLMHGLLQAAPVWLDAREASLATLLAKNHDVWLLSARGSTLARQPPGRKFWSFSADDIGRFDLPAYIDYILNITNSTHLTYIGFSQGAGTFFIMCSELPQYCKKVQLMIALAPATRMFYTKSPVFRLITTFCSRYEEELNASGVWEIFPQGGFAQSFVDVLCKLPKVGDEICESVKDAFDARNPGSISALSLKSALTNSPAGTSVHNLAWYGQKVKSKRFKKFDYRPEKNLIRYRTKSAPSYNLSAVSTPTAVFYGKNDGVVDVKDVKWMLTKLPNVMTLYEMEDPMWTHLDFVLSKNVPELLYLKIRDLIG